MTSVGVRLLLVTGRTVRQGRALESGKLQQEYMDSVAVCEVDRTTLRVLGVTDGGPVRVETIHGSVVVRCRVREGVDPGIAFMPCGPYANAVTGGHTATTGMPEFKGIDAVVLPAPGEGVPTPEELLRAQLEEGA